MKYRKLRFGEVLKEGDEVYDTIGGYAKWRKVVASIGCRILAWPGDWRRPLKSDVRGKSKSGRRSPQETAASATQRVRPSRKSVAAGRHPTIRSRQLTGKKKKK